MSANLDRYATFTRELADLAARTLRDELDLPQDRAHELGLRISLAVCEEFAGEIIYVAKDTLAKVDARDRQMLAAYIANGRNITPVAKEFGVCVQTAYRRIRMAEDADYATRQPELPLDPTE